MVVEIIVVLLLTSINAVFAMSELAVVSSRRARLVHMADRGNRGARVALKLVDDPGRFLSTVQIGITLVGIIAGAYSGATLGDRLGDWLEGFPSMSHYGDTIGVTVVVIAMTYLSLVVGELVPKRIALTNPERIAAFIAIPMQLVSRAAAPAVWVLKVSIEATMNVLRISGTRDATVNEEEIKTLIAEGTLAGVFAPQERVMIEGVLRMADRPVRAIMTPRTDIVWVDVNASRQELLAAIEANCFSRLLVCDGEVDRAVGFVHTKDMLPIALRGEQPDLKVLMIPVLHVPEHTTVLKMLDVFKRERMHMAVVIDEYGTTEGLTTVTDVLESIAGELPRRGEEAEPLIVQRDDGSWLVDGMLPIDEFGNRTGLRGLREGGDFHTIAGFMLQKFGDLPHSGASFRHGNARFEVVDMDGRRIDKVLVEIKPPSADQQPVDDKDQQNQQ